MDTSGAFNTSDYNGRYLTFSWSLASQEEDTNTSVINWSLKGAGTSSEAWYYAGNFKVVIDNITVYSSSTRIKLYNGTIVSSGSFTLNHNIDGSKTFEVEAQAGIYSISVNCTGSDSWSLPPINRNAYLVSVANFTDIEEPSFTFTNPSRATLKMELLVGSTLIKSETRDNPDSPYIFTLTAGERDTLRNLTPNSNYLEVTYKLSMLADGVVVSTDEKTATMSIVEANPIVSNISYRDTNSTTIAITGNDQKIIQDNSNVSFTLGSIQALKGATLSEAKITINSVEVRVTLSGNSQINKNITFGIINSSSDLPATIKVTDSRGNSITSSIDIDILAWSLPKAIVSVKRQNNYLSDTDIKATGNYSTLGGLNSVSLKYRYKESSSSTYGSWNNLTDGVTTTISLDNTKAYDIEVKIEDRLGSTVYKSSIDRGIPILFIDRLKRSVGINCFPAREGSIESSSLVMDDLIHIGSQELYSGSLNTSGYTPALSSSQYSLIQGLFTGVTIPQGYVRAYRITAQVSTTSSNLASIKLNNIESDTATTGANTNRKIISTRIFKESEIILESNNTILYIGNTTGGVANFYSITLQAYLCKSSTVLI